MQTTNATALPRYADWLTTDQVADQCGVAPVVVNNWIVTGIKTDSGRIRLKAVKVGGRWKIDPAAVTAFFEASTVASLPESATAAASSPKPASPAPESEAARKRRAERCMAELRERGVGLPLPSQPRTRKT